MEKNNFKTVNLGKGVVEVYDFGAVKLHAYKTNDLITDECFLLEKGGKMFMDTSARHLLWSCFGLKRLTNRQKP